MRADADRRLRALFNEFGLTPTARSKVKVVGGDDPTYPASGSSTSSPTKRSDVGRSRMSVDPSVFETYGGIWTPPRVRRALDRHLLRKGKP